MAKNNYLVHKNVFVVLQVSVEGLCCVLTLRGLQQCLNANMLPSKLQHKRNVKLSSL